MEFDGDPWETRMPAFGMNPVNLDRLITTEFVNPPIPNRNCDWSAVYEGYEPGDQIGWGETEEEAISELEAL
jgi:hypothetical protein